MSKSSIVEKKRLIPKCKECHNTVSFKVSERNQCITYCNKCYEFNEYPINNGLITTIFKMKDMSFINSENNDIICKRCNKIYCPKCYLEHEDYIQSIQMKPIKVGSKNNRTKQKHVEIINFFPYKIKCNKCNRQYLEGRLNENKQKKHYATIDNLIDDFNLAKHHIEIYYTQRKNILIDELKRKIKQIEDYYQKSLSFHQNIFQLINQIIMNYNKTKSDALFDNLNTLCYFNYSKFEGNQKTLDSKINSFLTFLSTNKIISDIPYSFFYHINVKEFLQVDDQYYSDIIKSNYGKFIFYNPKKIFISNPNYDSYSLIIKAPYKKKLAQVLEINSNQLLINYGKKKLDICTFTNRTYSFSHLPAFFKTNVRLDLLLYVTKDKNIIAIFKNEFLVFKSTPPYSLIKKKEIRTGRVQIIYQLHNENLVLKTEKDNVDSLIFYDYKKWKKIYVYTDFNNSYYWRDNSIHELSNGKMVLQRFRDGFYIFNTTVFIIY